MFGDCYRALEFYLYWSAVLDLPLEGAAFPKGWVIPLEAFAATALRKYLN